MLFLFFTQSIIAETAKIELSTKIETLIQQQLPNTNVGIVIRDAKTGKTLYAKNAHQVFIPASGTKLFSACAALLALGPDYQFETTLKAKDQDLYFQFNGDPSLSTNDLTELCQKAKTTGIAPIHHIYMDDTRFQGLDYALGWDWNSTWWYYGAPITTVILNGNAIPVQLLPTNGPGEKIIAQFKADTLIKPKLSYDLKSVTSDEANYCVFMVNTNTENDIQLSGCWPTQKKESTLKIAIKNPCLIAKQIILDALKNEITPKTLIKTGISTHNLKGLKTIIIHRSKPLNNLLTQVLQDSDNVYTESLTKTLGATVGNEGTFQGGVQIIQKTLNQQLGLDFSQTKMMDGSGLSRYNLISPQLFSELLYKMHHHPSGQSFKNALPVSGETGTLKNRLQATNEEQEDLKKNKSPKILAKTGTMTGVSTLSGYLDTKHNQTLIFSIMINNTLDTHQVKVFEDALCQLLFEEL